MQGGSSRFMRNPNLEADEWRIRVPDQRNSTVFRMVGMKLSPTARARSLPRSTRAGRDRSVSSIQPSGVSRASRRTETRGVLDEEGVRPGSCGLPSRRKRLKLMPRTPSSVHGCCTRRTRTMEWIPDDEPRRRPTPGDRGRELLRTDAVIESGVAAGGAPRCARSASSARRHQDRSRGEPRLLRMGSARSELSTRKFTLQRTRVSRTAQRSHLDLNKERGSELRRRWRRPTMVAENKRGGALERRGLGTTTWRAPQPARRLRVVAGLGRGGSFGEMRRTAHANYGFSGAPAGNHPARPIRAARDEPPRTTSPATARGRRCSLPLPSGRSRGGHTSSLGEDRGCRVLSSGGLLSEARAPAPIPRVAKPTRRVTSRCLRRTATTSGSPRGDRATDGVAGSCEVSDGRRPNCTAEPTVRERRAR